MRNHSTGSLSKDARAAQEMRYREGRHYDVLIVGTGMAALSAAALLVRSGRRVCMLEQHDVPGGYAHTFQMGDYRFCAQVHYIWGCGPGERVRTFLGELGLADEVGFERFDASGYDHMVLPDRRRVPLPYGWENVARAVDAAYPGQYEPVRRFTRVLERLDHEVATFPDPVRWYHWFLAPRYLGLVKYRNATLSQVFDECGLSREARAVLAANTGNFMCPPKDLSIFAYNGLMSGYNRGAYYPTHHFGGLVERIARVITDEPGSHIYYQTEVAAFDVEGDRVTGVTTRCGKTFTAPIVLCNMDPQAASRMIGLERFPREYRPALSYDYSLSAITVYLGLQGIDLREHGFGKHNIWYLDQWDVDRIWQEALAGDWSRPWMFLASPTLHTGDPRNTPPGGQVLELATGADYGMFRALKDSDTRGYLHLKNRIRDRLLDLAEEHFVPDLRRYIKVKVTGSPTTNEDFCGAPRGHAYAQALTPKNMGLGRLKAATPWKNFYWCNAASGYAGVNGTIGTGMQLYTDLTGDRLDDGSQILELAGDRRLPGAT